MEQQQMREHFFTLIEAIAYFLAGSYIVDKVISIQTTNNITSWQVNNWVAFVVGIILMLAGFTYSLSVLPFFSRFLTFIRRILQGNHNLVRIIIAYFLFAITMTQVALEIINRLNINGYPSWFIGISIAFIATIMITFIFWSKVIYLTTRGLTAIIVGSLALAALIPFTEDFTNKSIKIFSIMLSKGEFQIGFLAILLPIILLVFSFFSREARLERWRPKNK